MSKRQYKEWEDIYPLTLIQMRYGDKYVAINCEEDSGHALWCVGKQSLGELDCPWVVVGPKRHEVELHHLLFCRLRELRSAVACVAGEESG